MTSTAPPAEFGPAHGFPADDYTPHGYLDIPTHTRRLSSQGVVRSHDIGFRWHYPALARTYGGRRETYRAGVRLGVDGALALAEFDRVTAPYHSKSIVGFRADHSAGAVTAQFHLVGADVIVARVRGPVRHRLTVRVDYLRQLGADHGWGESGLVGRDADDAVILQGFEDGEAFALWVSQSGAVRAITADRDSADGWSRNGVEAPEPGPVTVLGGSGDRVGLSAVVEFPGERDHDLTVMLARGRTEAEARDRLARAREESSTELAARLAEDRRFWTRAPWLIGDWPAHWRRGLVYDLETLRMMVKPPVGIYTQPWDAMQVQAPRVVLGEAAIDALLLGYADPITAQRMMLGTFVDALAPNVPCSREDGSVNMVSADGSVCGTGPQWGYPWLVLRRLYDLNPDLEWLNRIYPHLAEYLDWWLAHRRDADGWLVHACSWESGQDLSPRFGEQPLGGGHPTYHLRPVDLHASFAHAASTMAEFATLLERTRDAAGWQHLAEAYADRTARLWTGDRYADTDGVTGEPTDVDDVMLWAPVALGLSGEEQNEAVRTAIRDVDPDTLVWPMFVWTVVDAALAAGEWATASRVAAAVVDRAYRYWDAPVHIEDRTLPGISCEYWPLTGRCGGEGYGWGAFGVHLLLGVLLGIRVADGRLVVRPNLPAELRRLGRSYGVRLTCGEVAVIVTLRPREDGVDVEVNGQSAALSWGEESSWEVGP